MFGLMFCFSILLIEIDATSRTANSNQKIVINSTKIEFCINLITHFSFSEFTFHSPVDDDEVILKEF